MTLFLSRTVLLGGAMSLAFGAVALAAPTTAPKAGAEAGAEASKKTERRVVVMRGGAGGDHGPMASHGRRHDPETRAKHLRDVLQLTPAQEPALTAFLEASKPQVRVERRERPAPDAAPPAPLTTPQRLDREAERMAKRQEAFAKRAAATKAFYAQLTPSQQKAFDALHQGRGGMHGPRIRVFRSGPGDKPMAFGPDGDVMLGDLAALEEFDIDLDFGEFDFDMPQLPEMPAQPELPRAPGA